MTDKEKEMLLARIEAVKGSVSDDLMRTVLSFIEEVASKIPANSDKAGFTSK